MSIRYERMNEEIKKTISEIIKDMKDPRVSDMTTIMSVDVTSGFITRELGKRMQLRALPKLNFKLDNSIEYSVHISEIIDSLHKNEK